MLSDVRFEATAVIGCVSGEAARWRMTLNVGWRPDFGAMQRVKLSGLMAHSAGCRCRHESASGGELAAEFSQQGSEQGEVEILKHGARVFGSLADRRQVSNLRPILLPAI